MVILFLDGGNNQKSTQLLLSSEIQQFQVCRYFSVRVSYEGEEERKKKRTVNPGNFSAKSKLLYLRAQEELGGLLVVSTIQK